MGKLIKSPIKYDKIVSEYAIVCATPDTEKEFRNSPLQLSIDKLGLNDILRVEYENKRGLSELYNEYIDKLRDQGIKKVVFIHDDVLIIDAFIIEKLEVAFESFDIVGLAGNASVDFSRPYMAWHLLTDSQGIRGEVMHGTKDDGKVWTTVFGPTKSRTIMIDGLFIAVNIDALERHQVRFNESYKFHHYDLAFCMNAYKAKMKCGVFPISVVHYGLGDSMQSEEWKINNEIFKKEYGE